MLDLTMVPELVFQWDEKKGKCQVSRMAETWVF